MKMKRNMNKSFDSAFTMTMYVSVEVVCAQHVND